MLRAWALMVACGAGCSFRPGALPTTDAVIGDDSGATVDGDVDAPPNTGAYRKPIAIDGTKLSGTQADFPLWLALVDPDLAAHASASGSDIYFTASDGTPLDHEIQDWVAATGTLRAWVRLPSLAQASPPTIYVIYGAPARASTPDPAGVFAASFAAVWHLDDSLATTTIVDASGNLNGTATGLATTARTAGQLGAGVTFDGSGTGYVSFTNPLTGNTPHTISVWVDQATVTQRSAILAMGTATQNQARWLYGHYSAATFALGFYSNDWVANINLDGAGWTHLVWAFEGANGVNRVYRDGAPIAASPQTLNGVATAGTQGLIGGGLSGFVTPNGMNGALDEIRIATVARSASWIAVEYANQHSPSTFYAVGAEEPIP